MVEEVVWELLWQAAPNKEQKQVREAASYLRFGLEKTGGDLQEDAAERRRGIADDSEPRNHGYRISGQQWHKEEQKQETCPGYVLIQYQEGTIREGGIQEQTYCATQEEI